MHPNGAKVVRKQNQVLLWVLLGSSLIVPQSSWACKELVKFPEHLSENAGRRHANFFVLKIIALEDGRFQGVVQIPLGENQKVGDEVSGEFDLEEEAHAVCPMVLRIGMTYLLHSKRDTPPLFISRFNGLNVNESHEKFPVYVEDLKAAWRLERSK